MKKFDSGCPDCGNTGIHACTGEPAREWTAEEREGVKRAFEKIVEWERIEKFKMRRFGLIDNE